MKEREGGRGEMIEGEMSEPHCLPEVRLTVCPFVRVRIEHNGHAQ